MCKFCFLGQFDNQELGNKWNSDRKDLKILVQRERGRIIARGKKN